MSTNPNISKAAALLNERQPQYSFIRDMIDLDSAGLLVTPLHDVALKACEEYAHPLPGEARNGAQIHAAADEVRCVGRESLAARKKPKERWVVDTTMPGSMVKDTKNNELVCFGRTHFPHYMTAPQARAVADALNKLEAR